MYYYGGKKPAKKIRVTKEAGKRQRPITTRGEAAATDRQRDKRARKKKRIIKEDANKKGRWKGKNIKTKLDLKTTK